MAATLSRVVLDRLGVPQMIVHPDDDAQLNDPAFSPAGTITLDVPRTDYSNAWGKREFLALLQPILAGQKTGPIVALCQARIDLIDAQAQADAELAALNALIDQFGDSPTGPQLGQLTASRAQADASAHQVTVIQDRIDNLSGQIQLDGSVSVLTP